MGNTVYASFNDPSLAEKAAGALLDHGVRPEDISVVQSHFGAVDATNYGTASTTAVTSRTDGDNDAKNAGDAALGETYAAGNKVAEGGDRLIGGIAGVVGATDTAANYRAAADMQNAQAAANANAAHQQWDDAVDRPTGTTNYAGNYPNDVNTPSVTATPASGTWSNDDPTSPNRHDVMDASGDTEASAKQGFSTTTPADAGAGAIKGTAWGVGIGALAALASLVVPGIGLVVGGGALAAALGGVAASAGAGAVAGAVTGYLKDQGVEEHVATHYENTINGGGAILAVTLPSGEVGEDTAKMILEKYGASNLNAYVSKGYLA